MREEEIKVLRLLAGGQRGLPKRDKEIVESLERMGLVFDVAAQPYGTFRAESTWDLTAAGVDAILEVDGPLTDDERKEWLSWPKTRFGKSGEPQKLLRGGWKRFSVPRARALMERWRKYGIRTSD